MDTRQEKIIRQTDLDALSLRHSANKNGYFYPADPYIDDLIALYQNYLHYTGGYTSMLASRTVRLAFAERKLPIINRGTYLRTKAIDLAIERFLDQYEGKPTQIVLLGGGSDTRVFGLLEKYPDLVYHELDFPDLTKVKKLAIEANPRLAKAVGIDPGYTPTLVNNRAEWEAVEGDIHTSKYHLVGFDLRNLTTGIPYPHLDSELPTLIISECVLCYVSPEQAELILKYWMAAAKDSYFIIYEPILLGDAFGATMAKNLATRGINLMLFEAYPTIDLRRQWLEKCGMTEVAVDDIATVGGYTGFLWISNAELARINRLELVDEVEEIVMLYKHYVVCYGEHHR